MTVVIGAKLVDSEGNITVRIATDSEVSFGSRRLLGISNSCEKVTCFPNGVVGCSGSGCVFEALALLQSDENYYKKVQFLTKDDIRDFARNLFQQYKMLLEESLCNPDDASMGVVVIATQDKLWNVYSDLSIFEADCWATSGSGGDTAHALMLAYYDDLGAHSTPEDLEKVLIKVIEKTCATETGCGLPYRIYSPGPPNPPITKKKIRKKKPLTPPVTNDKVSSEAPEARKYDKQRRFK